MDCSTAPLDLVDDAGTGSTAPEAGFAALALPGEDPIAIDGRSRKLLAEMRPRSELARLLVFRVALLQLRLERAAAYEAAVVSRRMRAAREACREARLAEADHQMSWVAAEPATNARLLRKTPWGIDQILLHFEGLRSDLDRRGGYRWSISHCDHLLNRLGGRYTDMPIHRPRALTHALVDGDFQHLDESDGAGLDRAERREWARVALLAFLDGKIADLKALLTTFDLPGLERDLEEAAARAMFDVSPEAILARKYEAATERSLMRTLREFREAQAETEAVADQGDAEGLGSFFPASRPDEFGSNSADSNDTLPADPGTGGRADRPKSGPKGARGRDSRRNRPSSGSRQAS